MMYFYFSQKTAARMKGITLVELMIALALGMLVLLGVLYVFSGNKQSYRYNEAMARLQENGRIATLLIEEDIRQAGYNGCRQATIGAIQVQAPGDAPSDVVDSIRFSRYIQPVTSGSESPGFVVGQFVVGIMLETSVGETDPLPYPEAGKIFQPGDWAIIADCESIEIFRVGTVSSSSITPAVSLTKSYAPGARIMTLPIWNSYFVADASGRPGIRSLFRRVAQGTPEELVEGVEAISLEYGMANSYRTGLKEEGYFLQTMAVSDQEDIGSLRLQLLLADSEPNLYSGPAREIPFGSGASVFPVPENDKRLYEVFSTTITVRNRLQ